MMRHNIASFLLQSVWLLGPGSADAFSLVERTPPQRSNSSVRIPVALAMRLPIPPSSSSSSTSTPEAVDEEAKDNTEQEENKFDMKQRIESAKAAVVGALGGGIPVAPITLLHHVVLPHGSNSNGLAQFEFATDMASLQAALFALVYRYAVRTDDNPMLKQGVVGAFVVTRTLAPIHVSPSCSAVPLQCGPPLGYFDWSMIGQGLINGLESAVLFGFAAIALETAFRKEWLSKFD